MRLIYCAWLIALIALFVSLFYGEILGFAPCPMCWYQRVALWPLSLLLGIALFRQDESIIPYGIALALVGALFAILQLLEHVFPALAALCGGTGCLDNGLMPVLSLIGSVSIALLLLFAKVDQKQ
jgi:disulfide bond formation protein DsbB